MRHVASVVTIVLILIVMATQKSTVRSVRELNGIAYAESQDIAKLQIQMLHMSRAQEAQAHVQTQAHVFQNPDIYIGANKHLKHLPLNHSLVAHDN